GDDLVPLMQDEDSGRQYPLHAERVIGADGAGSALRKALGARGLATASHELPDHDYKELPSPAGGGRSALAVREALSIRPRHGAASNEGLAHEYKEVAAPAVAGRSALAVPEALHIWPRHGFMVMSLPNADCSFTSPLFVPREGSPGFSSLEAPGAARAFFQQE